MRQGRQAGIVLLQFKLRHYRPGRRLDISNRRCHTPPVTDRDPTKLTLDDWIADLEISEAEVEAGEFVPGEVVSADIRVAIERLEARLAAAPQQKVAPRR